MGQNINLDAKFNEYFYELEGFALRAERLYDALEGVDSKEELVDTVKIWLKAAFMQGAQVMADDSVDALQDYATAVSGIANQVYSSEQAYDIAADALGAYYLDIFKRHG